MIGEHMEYIHSGEPKADIVALMQDVRALKAKYGDFLRACHLVADKHDLLCIPISSQYVRFAEKTLNVNLEC